jgi:hypothetical protein
VRFGVPVEARGIGQDGTAREDGDATIGLLGGGEDAEGAFAAGDRKTLTLELVDDVVGPRIRRGGANGNAHVEWIGVKDWVLQQRAVSTTVGECLSSEISSEVKGQPQM